MLTLEIKNLGRLTKFLERRINDALNDIADEVGAKSDSILRDKDWKIGSFNNGDLARSLVIDKETSLIKEVGYEAFYAIYIEYGTNPHYPPIDVIYEWVRKKQNDVEWIQPSGKVYINPKTQKEYNSGLIKAAYSIVNHIGREGTDAKPFIRPALEYGRSRTKEILKNNLEREKN